MANLYQYIAILVVAAIALLWLSERWLVRIIGVATLSAMIPAAMSLAGAIDWRFELGTIYGGKPTVLGYVLVASFGFGLLVLVACCLSALLRQLIALSRWGFQLVRKSLYAGVGKKKKQNA